MTKKLTLSTLAAAMAAGRRLLRVFAEHPHLVHAAMARRLADFTDGTSNTVIFPSATSCLMAAYWSGE